MKQKLKELDVDFIGGQGPLTKDEEIAISKFIKTQKDKNQRLEVKATKGRRTKETV